MEDLDYEDSLGDIDDDMFYDFSYDDADEDYISAFMDSYSIKDLWDDCLFPTLSDGFSASFKILICCLLLRFTSSLDFLPIFIIHLTSGATGLYCLHNLFGRECVNIVIYAVLGYSCIVVAHYVIKCYRGVICAAMCFLLIVISELWLMEPKTWHKIRGSQMILTMKLISMAFDIDIGELDLPNVIECFGYLFSVSTVIFGPWASFSTYCKIIQHHNQSTLWAVKVAQSALLSFGFLTISTCWTAWFLHFTSNKWLAAYRDALSFRSSHYFVSYMSESHAVASGMSTTSEDWGFPVARPYMIEFPRSLVEVVICWNIPMHHWLKQYVFKMAKPLGNFAPVLLTYIASSLLHGLNFQLAAVLLSLGFYTYIEHVLRKKLAGIFSACILARSCRKDCEHVYKSSHPYVIVCNIVFGALAMFHLAYLGVMFDSTSSIEEEGYNMQHTLEKWSELDYASHWTAAATYGFYFLI